MAAKGTLTIRVLGDASDFKRAMKSAQSGAMKFGKILAAGMLAAGASVAGALVFSVKKFADFDQAMTRSTAIMGDVSDAMRNDMASAAREVAKTTAFSATEAADSFFFLASAGLDAAESIGALPKVAAFAQAGAFDMALATDLLTDAQSALGLVVDDSAESLKNMVRVSDVLVKANTLANASVQQFSEALTQKAGAALRALNKDVEEGVAVLAVFADQGVKGAEAGVALNAVLEGLTRTARLNADSYRDLGVSVFDVDGEMRNMADIISDIETGLEGMSIEAQLAALAQLGLTRTARDGVVQLLGTSDAMREYEASLRDAAGTTQDVADKQMQTFWMQMGLVKDQLIDVALSVGQTLMPALEGFAAWLQAKLPDITYWFNRVSGKFMDLLGVSRTATQGSIDHAMQWNDVWDDAAGGTVEAVAQMERKTGQSFANITEASVEMKDQVVSDATDWTAHWETAAKDFSESTGKMDDEFTEAGEFMSKLMDAWKTIWRTEVEPWFMTVAVPWVTQVFAPELARAFGRAAWAGIKALVSSANDGWREMGDQLSGPKIGADLGRGLIEGVESMYPKIAEVFGTKLPEQITGPLTDGLEIRSPSKLFFRYGVATMQGYIDGAKSKGEELQKTMRDIFAEVAQGVSTILGGVGAIRGRADAQRRLTEAEVDLAEARERKQALPGEIADAESELAALRAEGGDQAEGLAESERRLADLRVEFEAIDRRLIDTVDALTDAQLAAVAAEQRLLESGQDLIALTPDQEDMFKRLAESAGLTSDAIDRLINRYRTLGEVAARGGSVDERLIASGSPSDIEGRIRDIFANRGVGIGTGTESESQRISRIAEEVLGGRTFEDVRASVDRIARNVPRLAAGGIVTRPTLALIGEAGPEAVIPLRGRGAAGGTVINITVTSADPQAVVEAIRRYTRTNGPLPIAVA